jgi:hypothetical protein
MNLKIADLAMWHVVPTARGDFDVLDPQGRMIFANLNERDATIAACAPRLLRFMGLLTERQGSPVNLDAGRVLALAGIVLE